MAQAPQMPLVVIIGATGTGKSKLAVDLALRFNGEIINGDAMQLYAGLPVITNKITEEEKQGIPHHLLGCIGLDEPTWTVGQFVPRALKTIDEIRSRGKLPILVGGTHYYTQSLLFKDVLADADGENKAIEDSHQEFSILQEPTETILKRLKEVDPVMADRWHPNDRRKIQRSLEIWLKTGKPASQVYEEQRARRKLTPLEEGDASRVGDGQTSESLMRFPALLLWVHAETEKLRLRLDSRVDTMLKQGLLSEVASLDKFLRAKEAEGQPVNRSRGIWVSIGYKEFEAYQKAINAANVPESDITKLKNLAIEQTQSATRQYAKRQIRWIRIKLLHALQEAGGQHTLFVLDSTDLARWKESVMKPAYSLVDHFLDGKALSDPSTIAPVAEELLTPKREYDLSQRRDLWERRYCEACKMIAVTESDWNAHFKSRSHRKAVSSKKKQTSAPERQAITESKVIDSEDSREGIMHSFIS